MAQKGGIVQGYPGAPPAGNPGPPPPYPGTAPGPATYVYPQAGTTVVVQQQAAPAPKVRTNHGIFGAISNDLNKLGRYIEKDLNAAGNMITSEWAKCNTGPVLNNFVTNNQIQLVSKASGRAVQIVMSPQGQLVVDGQGQIGPQIFNAIWTVVAEGSNQVRLHNNNNYLAIVNGCTCVVNMPPGAHHGAETKFQLGLRGQNFVNLESLKERGKHVGILHDGSLKPALACGGSEDHALFGVNLIYSPYAQAAAAAKR